MGWISQTYRDGRRLVWHNGGIDGFATYIGFFPEDDLGLVVLTNMGPLPRGVFFSLLRPEPPAQRTASASIGGSTRPSSPSTRLPSST